MNKTLKIIIGILLAIVVLWGIVFGIDYNRCANLKMPIFIIKKEIEDNIGTGTYYGLGYKVEVDKNKTKEYGIELERVEMYMFDKVVTGVITEKVEASEVEDKKGITTTLTLEDEIQNDTIWCGTFQLIWNDLKNELAKQDIIFTPQLKVVENLNKETFTADNISDKYYYKKLGHASIELKEEIEKAIKDKFNEKSDILDNFRWEDRNPGDYFLYAMLKKEFEFEKKFEELEKGKFGKFNNIEYFGIKSKENVDELRQQVKVLYYNSKEDFAIELETKQEDEIILCKNPEGKTFNEIYQSIKKEEKTYNGNDRLEKGELLKIPNIEFKEKNEFPEIQNKMFEFSDGNVYMIEKAIQAIEFELDRKGGRIKSEAGMMIQKNSIEFEPEEKREFFVDDTFAIFLIEEGKELPYFAAKINDITKFQ